MRDKPKEMSSTVLEAKESAVAGADSRVLAGPASGGELPAWLAQVRDESWAEFQTIPAPGRKDETWRFSNLKALDLTEFNRAATVPETVTTQILERSSGLDAVAGRMVFANDELVQGDFLAEEWAKKGVIWTTLEQAAVRHEELFRKYFMAQDAVLGGRKFAALHRAHLRSGTFLYVPANVELELPLEVFHWLHGENASVFPHTLLVAGENSKVTLVDYFESADARTPGFACGVNDLHLEAGAKLTYVCVQNWSRKTASIQLNATTVGRDASATSMTLNLGSAYARTESVSRLVGAGGRSDMLSVSVADGDQEFDQRTLQVHEAPSAASDLLYKNSLDDKARTIFSGLIRVEPGAHKTDAYQKVRNLLLSDDAEANSAPGLEIEADDVRCTHGATSGQVEPEELFYLLSRGIPKKQAQKLIVHGFLQEAIDRVGNEAVARLLAERVHEKFER